MKRLIKVLLLISSLLLLVSCANPNPAPTSEESAKPLPTTPSPQPPVYLPPPALAPGIPPPRLDTSIKVTASTDKPFYLSGENVSIKFSLSNITPDVLTLSNFPPRIEITRAGITFKSFDHGSQVVKIQPGDAVAFAIPWDQRDTKGNLVNPSIYVVRVAEGIPVTKGTPPETSLEGQYSSAEINIRFLQGAMEKIIEVGRSETANGITVNLQRIELTSSGTKILTSSDMSGRTLPPPSLSFNSEAEYLSDAEVVKLAGSFALHPDENGMLQIAGFFDPVPVDAKELTFRITKIWDWEGPWVFKVPLQ